MWLFVVVGAMSAFVWQETAKMLFRNDRPGTGTEPVAGRRLVRSLIQMPNWDGKIVLAALYTAGYFWIVYTLVSMTDLNGNQKEIATIALAALGPQLGQIFGAIYRHTLSDERDAERRTDALKTAIETPSVMPAAAPTPTPEEIGDQVEIGARDGARAGVEAGLDGRTDK